MSHRGFNPSNPNVRAFAAACRDARDRVEVTLRPEATFLEYEVSTASGVSLVPFYRRGGDRFRVPRSRVAELVAEGFIEQP